MDDSSSSSIAALVPFLNRFRQFNVDPASVFSEERDLPPWLREVAENTLQAVDAATLAAHTGLPAAVHRRSYWIKASSVVGLQHAVAYSPDDVQDELRTLPLCVYLMPTTPLADAQGILNISTGVDVLALVPADGAGEEAVVAVSVHNTADLEAKVASFRTVQGIAEQIRQAREMVAEHTRRIVAVAQANVARAQELRAEYDAAKQLLEAAKAVAEPEADGSSPVLFPERINMMLPFSRFLVAQEVAKATTTAAGHLAALDDLLAGRQVDVEGFTKCLTFRGCAPPPGPPQPPAAAAAAAAADAHGDDNNNAA